MLKSLETRAFIMVDEAIQKLLNLSDWLKHLQRYIICQLHVNMHVQLTYCYATIIFPLKLLISK